MVSFTFLLCSTLLICGTIAAPNPGAEKTPPIAEPNEKIAAKIDEQSKEAAEKVYDDVVAGKDVNESLRDRSIEASHNLMGEVASVVHSISKRLNELKNGDSLGVVAGRMWNAIQRKMSKKNESFDKIVKSLGSDNIKQLIEGLTNIIKALLTSSVNNGQALKDIDGVDKATGEKLAELAKGVKN